MKWFLITYILSVARNASGIGITILRWKYPQIYVRSVGILLLISTWSLQSQVRIFTGLQTIVVRLLAPWKTFPIPPTEGYS